MNYKFQIHQNSRNSCSAHHRLLHVMSEHANSHSAYSNRPTSGCLVFEREREWVWVWQNWGKERTTPPINNYDSDRRRSCLELRKIGSRRDLSSREGRRKKAWKKSLKDFITRRMERVKRDDLFLALFLFSSLLIFHLLHPLLFLITIFIFSFYLVSIIIPLEIPSLSRSSEEAERTGWKLDDKRIKDEIRVRTSSWVGRKKKEFWADGSGRGEKKNFQRIFFSMTSPFAWFRTSSAIQVTPQVVQAPLIMDPIYKMMNLNLKYGCPNRWSHWIFMK